MGSTPTRPTSRPRSRQAWSLSMSHAHGAGCRLFSPEKRSVYNRRSHAPKTAATVDPGRDAALLHAARSRFSDAFCLPDAGPRAYRSLLADCNSAAPYADPTTRKYCDADSHGRSDWCDCGSDPDLVPSHLGHPSERLSGRSCATCHTTDRGWQPFRLDFSRS